MSVILWRWVCGFGEWIMSFRHQPCGGGILPNGWAHRICAKPQWFLPIRHQPCRRGVLQGALKRRRPKIEGARCMQAIGKALGQSLDQATYAGYRVGFEAAREEAALMAELAGQGGLAAQIRAMRPLPDKHEKTA